MKLAALFLTLAFIGSTQAWGVSQMLVQTNQDHLGSLSGVSFQIYDTNGVGCSTQRFTTADGFNDNQLNVIVGSQLGDCANNKFTGSSVRDVYVLHDGRDDWGWSYIEVDWTDDASSQRSCRTQGGNIQGDVILPFPCS